MATVGTLNINFASNVASLVNDMRRAGNSVQTTSNKISKSLKIAERAFQAFVGVMAGRGVIRMADEFLMLQGRIQNSTRSTEEFTQAFTGLKNISKETGAELNATVSVFQRLSFVRDEIEASTAEMLQFTDTVSKLGIISGASTQAMTAGLTQLGQALSAEIVRAEEWNSIMENIPAVGKAIADQFGITTGQLRQLVIEGEVLSKDVFAAVLAQADEANQKFEKLPKTVGRAFSAMKIRMMEAVAAINDATSGTGKLITVIDKVGQTILVTGNLIASFALSISGIFDAVRAAILGALTGFAVSVEKMVNFVIEGLNKVKKEKIEPFKIDLIPNLAGEGLAATESFFDKMRKAEDRFLKASQGVDEIYGIDTSKVKDVVESIEEEGRSVEGLKEKYQGLAESLKDATDKKDKAKKKGKELSDTLEDIARKGLNGQIKSWRDLGQVALDVLQQILFKQINVSKAMEGISMFGGGGGSGLFGSLVSGIGGFFGFGGGGDTWTGPLPQRPPGRAIGGPVTGGKTYMVGENGPELYTPRSAGSITPNHQMGSVGGGGTYYIDARGADQGAIARLEAIIRQLNGSIERRALSVVRSEFNKNPKFLS